MSRPIEVPAEPRAGSGNGAVLPAELVGSWIHGMISPTNFHDAYTGKWATTPMAPPSSSSSSPTAGTRRPSSSPLAPTVARRRVYIYNEGRAEVEGSVFEVYPTAGTITARDNCVAANNYDRPDNLANKQGSRYGWTLKLHDDGKTYLLIGPDNDMTNPSYFSREQ